MQKRLLLLFLMIPMLIFANDIDEKLRELQRLNTQVEKTEQELKQTAEKKKRAERELSRTSSLKKETDRRLRGYRVRERAVKDSLDQVGVRLLKTQQRLDYLNQAQSKEFELLLKMDRGMRVHDVKHKSHRYLCNLLHADHSVHSTTMDQRRGLESSKETHGREANIISRNVQSENRKSRKYQSDIRTYNTQTAKLSKEQQALQQKVNKLKQDAAGLQDLINRLMAEEGKTLPSYEFTEIKILWPLRGRIIRSFGQETRAYNTSVVSNGIDIAVREGTNVLAVDDGEVVFSDRYGGQGKLIIIDHKNGFFSLYGYNKDLNVQRGAHVRRGQVIAKSGMTGSASEPSLHFELRKDGRAVNPLPYFE
ncbi:MAG TPA: peptidoglycan DD-metalloendopeptidase family protein [Candidatus Cloacimonetes bacterium]|nr:peptidoglycan DD-metalloendopeptidase family protein [Candidatus Cloacimonadota bacterium]